MFIVRSLIGMDHVRKEVGLFFQALLICLLLAPGISYGDDSEDNIDPKFPKQALDKIHDLYPQVKIHPGCWEKGNLTDDAIEDIVVQINCFERDYESENNDSLAKIIILQGQFDSEYRVVSQSLRWLPPNHTSESLVIKDKSLFISINSSGANNQTLETYQFKRYGDDFLLIGSKVAHAWYNADLGEPSKPIGNYKANFNEASGNSVNYLTHEMIYWKKTDQKYAEKKIKYVSEKQFKLQQFNSEQISDRIANYFGIDEFRTVMWGDFKLHVHDKQDVFESF